MIPNCTANVTMYKITVMDQYSSASVSVSPDQFSSIISDFPDSGTSIVANKEYTITITAISYLGTNLPSDPIVVSKFSLCMYYMLSIYVAT